MYESGKACELIMVEFDVNSLDFLTEHQGIDTVDYYEDIGGRGRVDMNVVLKCFNMKRLLVSFGYG